MKPRNAIRTTTTILLGLALALAAGCATAQNSTAPKEPKPSAEQANPGSANKPQSLPGASETNGGAGSNAAAGGTKSGSAEAPGGANGGGQTNAGKPSSPAPTAPSGGANPAGHAVKKLYRMNAVYSFVPIDKAAASAKVVLLTFDDGPKADKTVTSLLDTLDKHKAKAIFFVNGYRVKSHPELLKKIADRGQAIGNHSWDHIDLKKEKEATVRKQIVDVQSIVKKVTGSAPVFFRPPFGSGNDSVKRIVRGQGMLYMTWSNGSLDWDAGSRDKPDKVIANVLEQLHPGVNILMHELPWTTEALDALLTKLEAKGYGFIDPASIDLGLDAPPKNVK
ncbi:polysaccharide deacetylase family protein [Paenibacillus sp. MWE-103]|uniref:Polysaccharide deacetylase family protein n=1 Tax=Paenibacillus artemisiicola TaxID=1172618 RepID=A0ABS3W6X5_9BACL|nr:polysaccharide deacetylase family protein [Paenibacillus artemisiicola]MBO7744061.1 polysaccharide deacetylase family protein [Paenibacillus artemisiicola]